MSKSTKTSTSTFNKQVQLHETSITWNIYKYMKQVQVHKTSKSTWNNYKYMKQLQKIKYLYTNMYDVYINKYKKKYIYNKKVQNRPPLKRNFTDDYFLDLNICQILGRAGSILQIMSELQLWVN